MTLLIFGLLLFLVIIVFLIYLVLQKEPPAEQRPTIHSSGIYSVVRRSPRVNIHPAKPPIEEVLAELERIAPVKNNSGPERERLLSSWKSQLEKNISVIEEGDKNGTELYFYQCSKNCSQNRALQGKNRFITREEIHNFPQLIPPLHIGCTCELVPDTEWKKGQTTNTDMVPLLGDGQFKQPDWKVIET